MPQAKQVLYCDYFIKLNNTIVDGSKCVIEGDLNIYMVYLSNDDASPLHYLYETVDFGKIVYIDGLEDDDMVDVQTQVPTFNAQVITEDSDTIGVEATLSFDILVFKNDEAIYVEDGYSTSKKLMMEKDIQKVHELAVKGQIKSIIRSSVEIPETMPTIARVLFFKAKPVISSGYCDQDRIYIEGIMIYNACYSSSEGTKSIKGEFAFSTQVQMEGFTDAIAPEICIDVDYINFDGAGRNIDLKITMQISAKGYETHKMVGVTKIEETDELVEKIQGMHIYFADSMESYWDIAKKYNTSIDQIEKYNQCENNVVDMSNKKIIIF
jgi:hypothetical protein